VGDTLPSLESAAAAVVETTTLAYAGGVQVDILRVIIGLEGSEWIAHRRWWW
jgi:hypothetical protein